ncbi:hypothetical protein BKH42_08495 [Helicobacter sp. 13S00482-2]|uniref:helix-turn-helix domain-containing protein n=1 Tax=Helicobacter sp. 13S00482-2 TaxID=1476200 RepID=UPI000BA5383A|nr:helix-turn-helix domain-containing protein [Helicobacter sp. 13S00482-2]PAF52967.1 hypothetical protein BKH42_08495 [Helicobacter sp. 13S00482-2]
MNMNYEKQLISTYTKAIIDKYGIVIRPKELANILNMSVKTIYNEISDSKDLPKYTMLKGKKIYMANEIARWLVENSMRYEGGH